MDNQSERQGNRVWIYCRTAHDDGITLSLQKEQLVAFAERQDLEIAGITAETGSGLDYSRPGLKEVMQAVRDKQTDIVLANDVSRIGRDMSDTILYLHELRRHRVMFATLKDSGSEIKPWICPIYIPEYLLDKLWEESKQERLVQK